MNTLIRTIEVLGIIAFAITGILQARKKGMDLVGVYAVAMITALGGGTLRDLILDRRPLFWVEHYSYPILLLILSVLMTVILVLDAFGLGLFSASGASLANHAGYHPFISALLGVITGVFGGVLRDIICNEIPYVFSRTELYATCAFAGAWAYLAISAVTGNEVTAVIACIVVTVVTRLLAIRYKIRLPI